MMFTHLSLVNRIKTETGTSILIPSNNEKSNILRIEGSPKGVALAKAEILQMVKKLVSPSLGKVSKSAPYFFGKLFNKWNILKLSSVDWELDLEMHWRRDQFNKLETSTVGNYQLPDVSVKNVLLKIENRLDP